MGNLSITEFKTPNGPSGGLPVAEQTVEIETEGKFCKALNPATQSVLVVSDVPCSLGFNTQAKPGVHQLPPGNERLYLVSARDLISVVMAESQVDSLLAAQAAGSLLRLLENLSDPKVAKARLESLQAAAEEAKGAGGRAKTEAEASAKAKAEALEAKNQAEKALGELEEKKKELDSAKMGLEGAKTQLEMEKTALEGRKRALELAVQDLESKKNQHETRAREKEEELAGKERGLERALRAAEEREREARKAVAVANAKASAIAAAAAAVAAAEA